MTFLAAFRPARWRASLAATALVALLQRAPGLRLLLGAESALAGSGAMAVVRSALAAAGALGAVHALAGASVLSPSIPGPLAATVGTPITPVGFTITNTAGIGSWKLSGAFPPGLQLMDSLTRTFLTGPGPLDAATPIVSNGSSTPPSSVYPVLTGTPTQAGSFTFQLQAFQYGRQEGNASGIFDYTVVVVTPPPSFLRPPQSAVAAAGEPATLSAEIPLGQTFQWRRNGAAVPGATSPALTLAVTPSVTGIYTGTVANSLGALTSEPVILGATTTQKVVGNGLEIAANIRHANGNIVDQILLQGAATLFTADAGQITRTSCVDGNDDIVQIEFSGAGTVSVFVNGLSGPAPAARYNQPAVLYVKGSMGLVIAGANETTNLSVFSVGRANAADASLFRSDVAYDGVADLAFVAIQSANGKFGGLRLANASFAAVEGLTGVFAPGVQFTGPVFVGDISAFDNATPVLILGAAADVRITGGDLEQANGRAVQVAGLTQLRMVDGQTSHGILLRAKTNRGRLERNGTDVTAQIVVNPPN